MRRMAEKKGVFVPTQKIMGMQVIDSQGSSVGSVKDIAINVPEKKINLIVTTRSRTDMDVPWEEITSIVDVVLLRKQIELPKTPELAQIPVPPPPPPAVNNCPNCGASVIPTARFCPKCGTKIR